MSNIIPAFNALCSQIHSYELTKAPLEPNNYLALELVPAVLYFIAKQMNTELPESCKLSVDREKDFVLSLLAIMNPIKHRRGATWVTNYEDLFDPALDGVWTRALNDDQADHLRSEAARRLEQYSDNPEAYEERYQRPFSAQRLFEISVAEFPCGFNGPREERYVYFDMRYLLFPRDPNVADVKTKKEVSVFTNNYLMRAGNELQEMEIMQEVPEQRLLDHLDEMMKLGHPVDYTIQKGWEDF